LIEAKLEGGSRKLRRELQPRPPSAPIENTNTTQRKKKNFCLVKPKSQRNFKIGTPKLSKIGPNDLECGATSQKSPTAVPLGGEACPLKGKPSRFTAAP